MTIRITKSGKIFTAECIDLPGSPPVGRNKDKEKAILYLFKYLLFEYETWGQYLNLSEVNYETI